MKVTPARRMAFEILLRVETESAYAADLLRAHLSDNLKREDAALATELTLGVLRWQRTLDFFLGRYLSIPLASLDTEVRLALRLGLYQLRFLERIPPRAAVHESVELVKRARKRSAGGLVNAVLRRAAAAAGETLEHIGHLLPAATPSAEGLGICYSHPTWLVERWLSALGEARTVALLEANNRPARVACAVFDKAHREEAVAALGKAGLRIEPGKLLRSALSTKGGNPAATVAFRRGWIAIQDEASQLMALLVGVRPGQSVLDLCAAPGGKTALLAQAAGAKGLVVAADRHAHRLRAMNEHLRRLSIDHVRSVVLDAAAPLPFATSFDRILVDAPCSGTGTLSRNPEIRWRLRPEDLADLHTRQVQYLCNALDHLTPGGRLVYSTCSLEPEENERVINEVLAGRREVNRVRDTSVLTPHLTENVRAEELFGVDGYLRTFPPEHQTDGFFAATLEREAPAAIN